MTKETANNWCKIVCKYPSSTLPLSDAGARPGRMLRQPGPGKSFGLSRNHWTSLQSAHLHESVSFPVSRAHVSFEWSGHHLPRLSLTSRRVTAQPRPRGNRVQLLTVTATAMFNIISMKSRSPHPVLYPGPPRMPLRISMFCVYISHLLLKPICDGGTIYWLIYCHCLNMSSV